MPGLSESHHRCTSAERVMAFVHDALDGDTTFTAVARCGAVLEPERLRLALARLQRRHAKLRCSLTSSKRGWPEFVEHVTPPPIPCEFRVVHSDDQLRDLMLAQTRSPFPSGTVPLVRLCVVTNPHTDESHLIGWFHHAAMDGHSTWRFFQELMLFYADPDFVLPEAAPGFGAKLPGPAWTRGMRWKIFQYLFLRSRERRRFPYEMPPFDGEPPGALVHERWTSEETTRLVERCRAERVTVYHALSAAAAQAMSDHYGWSGKNLACLAPISIRDKLDPPVDAEVFGSFVASSRVTFPILATSEEFWTQARRFRATWEENLRQRDPIEFLRIMGTVRLFRFWVRFHGGALTVNNMGRLTELPDHGQPRISDFTWFGRSTHTGAICHVNAATVQNRLSVTLRAEHISEAALRSIADRLDDLLHNAIGTHELSGPKFLSTARSESEAGVYPVP